MVPIEKKIRDDKKINPIEILKWMSSSIFVPLVVAIIASGYFANKSVEIIYHEVPIIENFNVLEYFPLKKGNYWVYDCYSETIIEGVLKKGKYKRKTQVDKVVVLDNFTYVLLSNSFFDIGKNVAKEDFPDSNFAYIIVSNKIYYSGGNNLDLDHLDCYKLNYDVELEFEFPLFNNQQMGVELSYLLRKDYRYRKVVTKEDTYFSKNENKIEEYSVFKIIDATLGSDSYSVFVPYRGIIEEFYNHHGSLMNFKSSLIETNVK